MKSKYLFLGAGLLFLAAGCSSQQPVNTNTKSQQNSNTKVKTTMATDLKTQLEQTYTNFRKAIETKDYKTFEKLFEPAKNVSLSEDKFMQASEMILDSYPALSTVKYIKTAESGEWAGYYIQSELNDPNYITVDVIKFHKVSGQWKVSGSISGSSFPKDSTTTTIESTIKNSEELQLSK